MSKDLLPPFYIVVPTLNAGPYLEKLLPILVRQSVQPERFIVMDSSSNDDTPQRFREFGAEVYNVARADFDHGGTRQAAISLLPHEGLVVLMTQDALPSDETTVERLLSAFDDLRVAVAYGRQLPRDGAGLIESHARIFNYPGVDHIDDAASLKTRGVRATFCSNSFAAYRLSALREVGGFPSGCIFGEDAVTATKLMEAGWTKAYVSSSKVFHSHTYSMVDEFRRYFDVGVLHKTSDQMRILTNGTSGEGLKFVRSELTYLGKRSPLRIFEALVRTGIKFLGYKAGKFHREMPVWLRLQFSMNRSFWQTGTHT
jgi:rhamnosyltransferase